MQHPMGDLMLDPSAKPAPERAALYRQLAVKLREVAMGDIDDQLRGDFLELARQYDARAANLWTPETGWTADLPVAAVAR
jgi:hypothetical protein